MLRNDAVIAFIVVGALTFYEGLRLPSVDQAGERTAVAAAELNAKDAKKVDGLVEQGLNDDDETQRRPQMHDAKNAKDTGRMILRVLDGKE